MSTDLGKEKKRRTAVKLKEKKKKTIRTEVAVVLVAQTSSEVLTFDGAGMAW